MWVSLPAAMLPIAVNRPVCLQDGEEERTEWQEGLPFCSCRDGAEVLKFTNKILTYTYFNVISTIKTCLGWVVLRKNSYLCFYFHNLHIQTSYIVRKSDSQNIYIPTECIYMYKWTKRSEKKTFAAGMLEASWTSRWQDVSAEAAMLQKMMSQKIPYVTVWVTACAHFFGPSLF